MSTNSLKQVLEKEGISQADFSKRSEISAATINRVCNGTRDVAPKTKFRILNTLNSISKKSYSFEDVFPGMTEKERSRASREKEKPVDPVKKREEEEPADPGK